MAIQTALIRSVKIRGGVNDDNLSIELQYDADNTTYTIILQPDNIYKVIYKRTTSSGAAEAVTRIGRIQSINKQYSFVLDVSSQYAGEVLFIKLADLISVEVVE